VTSDRDALEVSVLKALCGSAESSRLVAAVEFLRAYDWADADRAVVFGAIRTCAERGAAVTHETLIGLVTRAGFPDVDLREYFAPGRDATLEDAVEKLLAARR
jgi:hypothetical protein